jgi:hypothetical protein
LARIALNALIWSARRCPARLPRIIRKPSQLATVVVEGRHPDRLCDPGAIQPPPNSGSRASSALLSTRPTPGHAGHIGARAQR